MQIKVLNKLITVATQMVPWVGLMFTPVLALVLAPLQRKCAVIACSTYLQLKYCFEDIQREPRRFLVLILFDLILYFDSIHYRASFRRIGYSKE